MARIIWFQRQLSKHCRSSADTFDGENSLERLHFHVTENEIGTVGIERNLESYSDLDSAFSKTYEVSYPAIAVTMRL